MVGDEALAAFRGLGIEAFPSCFWEKRSCCAYAREKEGGVGRLVASIGSLCMLRLTLFLFFIFYGEREGKSLRDICLDRLIFSVRVCYFLRSSSKWKEMKKNEAYYHLFGQKRGVGATLFPIVVSRANSSLMRFELIVLR